MQPFVYDILQPDVAVMSALLGLHRQNLLNGADQLPAQLHFTQIIHMQIGQMHTHAAADIAAHDGRRHIA
ncbi:hypothetical protein D3C86_2235490 [compost metagenome]